MRQLVAGFVIFLVSFQLTKAFLGGNREALRREQCRIQGIGKGQYSSYCRVTSLRIIGLDIGNGQFGNIRNLFSYTGAVLRSYNVRFMTEQNGYGDVLAKFNGQKVRCDGWAGKRFKTCTVPRTLRPWSGRFTVEILGRSLPSAGFSMAGKPLCPRAGFEGFNCNTDINECTRYKNLCHWKKGCVNTIGSFRCTCPPGFVVSSKNPRMCEDINECEKFKDRACHYKKGCVNTVGGFRCTCPAGFIVSPTNWRMCEDVNECEKYKNLTLCAWKPGCVNVFGGYRCKCPPGYVVSPKDFRRCDLAAKPSTKPPQPSTSPPQTSTKPLQSSTQPSQPSTRVPTTSSTK